MTVADSTKEVAEAASKTGAVREVSVTKVEATTTDRAVIETTIVGRTEADTVTLETRSAMAAGTEEVEMTGAESTMAVEATGETTTTVVVMVIAMGDTQEVQGEVEEELQVWQVAVENTAIVTEEKNQIKVHHRSVWRNVTPVGPS